MTKEERRRTLAIEAVKGKYFINWLGTLSPYYKLSLVVVVVVVVYFFGAMHMI